MQRLRTFFFALLYRVWRLLLWHSRLLLRLGLALVLLLLILAGSWQFWVIPRLEQYRPWLVAKISQSAGMKVEVGVLEGGWDGLRPELTLRDVRALNQKGQAVFRFSQLQGALSWWALPLGQLEFSRIVLKGPELHMLRLANGQWQIAGVKLNPEQGQGSDSMLNWLLDQGGLEISQGKLILEDAAIPDSSLEFNQLSLQESRLFGWRRLSFGFTPPADIGLRVTGNASLHGRDISLPEQWSGNVDVKIPRIDLAKLNARTRVFLPDLSSRFPAASEGVGRLSLDFTFAGKKISQLNADAGLEKLRLERSGQVFDLPFFDAVAHWKTAENSENLTLNARRIDVAGGVLARNGYFAYALDKEERSLELRTFNLDGLAAYVPLLPEDWSQKLAGAKLGGAVNKLLYAWKGDWKKPASWRGEADIKGLTLGLPRLLPQLGKLDVSARFDQSKGDAKLSSRDFLLDYPAQFLEPLALNKLDAAFNWQKQGNGWEIEVKPFAVANAEAEVSVSARYRWSGDKLGTVDLNGDIVRLPANRVYAYLPRAVGDDTLAWLKGALKAGDARNGKAVWKGDLARFPYSDGSGLFRITTQAQDVTLNYGEGWPALTGINGELKFEASSMSIKASKAKIFDVELKDIDTRIPDLSANQHVLVDGKASGTTASFVRFVRESPVSEATQGFLDSLKAEGLGQLEIKLDIPIADTNRSKVQGRYSFSANRLDFGGSIPLLTQAGGKVDFSESTLKISDTSAKSLGGVVKLSGASENGSVKLILSGDAQLSELAQRYALPQPKRFLGNIVYQGDLLAKRDRYELNLQSPFANARMDLPQPVGKPAGEVRPLRFKASGDGQRQALEFSYGKVLQGVLALQDGKNWTGVVSLGSSLPGSILSPKGIQLVGGWPEMDVSAWQELLDGNGQSGQASLLSSVDLSFDRLIGWEKRLESVHLKASPTAQGWTMQLTSKQAGGNVLWRGGTSPRISGKLDFLKLPLPSISSSSVEVTPLASMQPVTTSNNDGKPVLDLVVDKFHYKDKDLGQLVINATPSGDGWVLNNISLSNPDGRFSLTGHWQGSGLTEHTQAKISLKSENTGKLLARLGYPDALQRAPTELTGEGEWRGTPFSPDLASLRGKLHLEVASGQFVKIEPGAGRLLSVISLQSVSRRLKFDFSDVFSDGLAFDSIKGDAVIEKGVAHTDNLLIDSPSAKVSFKGDANIPEGTQNMRVHIVPMVGDATALAVGVVNPIAGAATFVVGRLMKDPIGQLISYEYDVTGPWDDPKVTKVNKLFK